MVKLKTIKPAMLSSECYLCQFFFTHNKHPQNKLKFTYILLDISHIDSYSRNCTLIHGNSIMDTIVKPNDDTCNSFNLFDKVVVFVGFRL